MNVVPCDNDLLRHRNTLRYLARDSLVTYASCLLHYPLRSPQLGPSMIYLRLAPRRALNIVIATSYLHPVSCNNESGMGKRHCILRGFEVFSHTTYFVSSQSTHGFRNPPNIAPLSICKLHLLALRKSSSCLTYVRVLW